MTERRTCITERCTVYFLSISHETIVPTWQMLLLTEYRSHDVQNNTNIWYRKLMIVRTQALKHGLSAMRWAEMGDNVVMSPLGTCFLWIDRTNHLPLTNTIILMNVLRGLARSKVSEVHLIKYFEHKWQLFTHLVPEW